ncbi:MAG: DUF1045 domain-containing protein [Tepidimonas taiwanensis]|nr:DUF1045 domain-containing protein [Tepidimonas taiwanensis]
MFKRVAIYYSPPPGALETFGENWLGWSLRRGAQVAQPPDLQAITATPRRYGFHATLKAPFVLAEGRRLDDLGQSLRQHCAGVAPVDLPGGLRPVACHGFLALRPAQQTAALRQLAAGLVRALDPYRAPLSAADRARRDPDRLTPAQRDHLDRWGYPWIFDDFEFHMTLSGPLPEADLSHWRARAEAALPDLSDPFIISHVALVGEDEARRFHLIEEVELAG